MMTPNTSEGTDSWRPLRRELGRRLYKPATQFSYVTFFLLAIVGISALGVWFEIIRAISGAADSGKQPILNAVYTYFPAIAFASAFQMIIGEKERFLRSFAIWVVFVITLAAMFLMFGKGSSDHLAYGISALGTVLSWFIWWVANADEPGLIDIHPASTLGGSTATTPLGNTEGFNV